MLGVALRLDSLQYGALAGLTVYAVPQVLAAAAPLGPAAVQMGTLVKLVRVLMLGPICVMLSLLGPAPAGETAPNASDARSARGHPPLHHLVPWFILGFLEMMALRSFGLVPHAALGSIEATATLLTVVSMAALGLGVDIRTVAHAGGQVTAAVVLSLLILAGISLALIHALHIG